MARIKPQGKKQITIPMERNGYQIVIHPDGMTVHGCDCTDIVSDPRTLAKLAKALNRHLDGSAQTTDAPAALPLADNPAAVGAVEAWLADPRRPSGPVYASARDLLTRIDAAISGGGA